MKLAQVPASARSSERLQPSVAWEVLAGDVGGTRARFALFDASGRKALHQDVLDSRAFPTFAKALARFLEGCPKRTRITAATFGIAGPVVDQRVKATNLPWAIDARSLSRSFGIPNVTLVNDMIAVGLGGLAARPSMLVPLHLGRPKRTGANVAVIAAGTGLGEAAFVWDGREHVPLPTEGSHVEFAPRTAVQGALLAQLQAEHGHVSYERVASGSTIHAIYRFFVEDQRVREDRKTAAAVAAAPDPNVAVVELAEQRKSEAAARALDLWCSVYGAEAGNLALKTLASGGVYVCGGVSARLSKILAGGLRRGGPSPFVAAFLDKGRMRALLERVPVAVCLEPMAGLLGAAAHAASAASARLRGRRT